MPKKIGGRMRGEKKGSSDTDNKKKPVNSD